MGNTPIRITECPRDAMQGLKEFIPTHEKIRYINALLKVGFEVIDFGSFVSPKAIPQMRDTGDVLRGLDLSASSSKLLSIVANKRGAIDALQFEEIDFLGFPFSISETFQIRNTNAGIAESLERVLDIQDLCVANNRKLVTYISMAFGNPYGDPWNLSIATQWVDRLVRAGIRYIALSDTVGIANPDSIAYLFAGLTKEYPECHFGAHFHTQPSTWRRNVEAAYANGCRRFDTAVKGFGGCPMAKDDLTGNLPTENLLLFCVENEVDCGIDKEVLLAAMDIATEIFPGVRH